MCGVVQRDCGISTSGGGGCGEGEQGTTHLAGVDLLAAEGIFVGTHVGGGGAVPVVLVLRCCRRG